MMEKVNVEDLALDFTIPGYDIELRVRTYFVFIFVIANKVSSLAVETIKSPQIISMTISMKFSMLS